MRESDVLDAILRDPPPVPSQAGGVVEVGPGDDLAVLRLAGDLPLLVGVDQVIDGVHVRAESTPWNVIARKAVARCVSDVAAMAGEPVASVIAVALPRGCRWEDSELLRTGLGEAAAALGAPLVGGDIAMHPEMGDPGPLTISVTVLARAPKGGAVLRSGAQHGDRIYVSGALGGAYQSDGSGHHLHFTPRVALATELKKSLGDRLHAMIDISDGLGRDAARIGAASNVQLQLEASDVPCRSGDVQWPASLSDGEDYELLFTVDPQAEIPDVVLDVPLTCVGVVVEGPGGACVRTPEGVLLDTADDGWDHGA